MKPMERVEAMTANGNVSLKDWDWLLRVARAAVAWREVMRGRYVAHGDLAGPANNLIAAVEDK